jgi:hypothetical protein
VVIIHLVMKIRMLRRVGKETKDTIVSMEVEMRKTKMAQSRKNDKVPYPLKNMIHCYATNFSGEEDTDDDRSGDTGGRHWVIVGNDESSPQIGVPAPNKLTIRLVHKKTKFGKFAQFRKIREMRSTGITKATLRLSQCGVGSTSAAMRSH